MKTINEDGSATYTKEDVDAMTPAEFNNVFVGKVRIEGKGVVRGADGNIKYDDDAVPGNYGEDHIN